MSKGGGAQGETRYSWNPAMEAYWGGNEANPGGLLGQATDLAGQGFKPYDVNERYSDFENFGGLFHNPDGSLNSTLGAAGGDLGWIQGLQRNMIGMSSSPLGSMNGARDMIEGTLGGEHLYRPGVDPTTGQPYDNSGANFYAGHSVPALNPFVAGPGSNEFIDQYTTTDRNAFGGNSPYFRDMMMSGMKDISDAYEQGVAADTTRMFNMAGAFGGSAHQKAMANNQAALGKSLGNFADSMLNQQYERSANLEDAFLNRDLQNQIQNRQTAGGWREAQLGRGFENFNLGTNLGFQGWENERNRQMGAIPLGQAEQGLAYGRMDPLLGTMGMRMGLDQQDRDFVYNQTQAQQQHPFQTIDWLSGIYGRAMGGGGMNQTIYGPSGSTAANAIGTGLGLYGMFRGGF